MTTTSCVTRSPPGWCVAGPTLVVVAEMLGHAPLETTRGYTRPTHEDAVKALELLDVDH